jgi:Arc/MetJ-type ribon-helix-helix transcriptional regulator
MIRMQVQLTEEQARGLRDVAHQRGVSVSSVVREAVGRLLEQPRRPTREELRRRALARAGKYDSGCTDVAERHDEHFVEAIESRWRRS